MKCLNCKYYIIMLISERNNDQVCIKFTCVLYVVFFDIILQKESFCVWQGKGVIIYHSLSLLIFIGDGSFSIFFLI